MVKVQQVSERHRKMEDQYREVCALFCENAKTTEPAEFFRAFHSLVQAYKNAEAELERRITEEETMKKAKRIQKQSEKTRKSAAANARLAAEVVQRRRRSELLVDHNDNFVLKHQQRRPMSSAISLNDSGNYRHNNHMLSLSQPRSGSMEQLLDKCEGDYGNNSNDNNALSNNPLFKRASKLFSESDPDILDDKKLHINDEDHNYMTTSKSSTLPLSRKQEETLSAEERAFQLGLQTSPVAGGTNGRHLEPPFE